MANGSRYRLNFQCDVHTLGSSKACEVLADMLNQNALSVSQRYKVLKFLSKTSSTFKSLADVKDLTLRKRILHICLEHSLQQLKYISLPEKIESYVKNVIFYYYNKNLKGYVD